MRSLISNDREMVPRGRTLRELELNMSQVGLIEAKSNIREDVIRRTLPFLSLADERREKVDSPEKLKEYQKFVRDSFIESIGGLPALDTPMNPKCVKTYDAGDFTVECIIFEPRPRSYVTCNLYRPNKTEGKVPAVLIPVGHTDDGKTFEEYQRVAQMLVHAGFIAFMFDPIGEGERFEHYEKDISFEPIQGCSGEHDLLDFKSKLTGVSLIRYFVHDGMRAIEYLLSRPDVSEVAVTGHSGGGTQTSALMTAASQMISAAAPCSYTTDKQAMIEYAKDPDNEMIWPGLVSKGIDYADIMAGMAPKPVLILSNSYDFFPREGTERTFERIKKLWKQVGSENEPALARVPTCHSFDYALAEAVTRFFSKHLLGRDADLTGFAFRKLSADVLNCTEKGQILEEYPDLYTTQDSLNQIVNSLAAARSALSDEERETKAVNWLKESISIGKTPCKVNVRIDDEGVMAHYVFLRLVWKADSAHVNNGVLIRDMRHGEKPLPTLIALWEDGTAAIARHSNFIHRKVAEGYQILITDLAGVGSCEPNTVSNTFMHIGWSTSYILNSNLMDIGDSIAALRTSNAISALNVIADIPAPYIDDYTFYGEGEFARYAKIAALITSTKVIDNRDYQTYTEIVTDKYHDQTHTHDWIWPGILTVTDMDEIDGYLKNKNLLI